MSLFYHGDPEDLLFFIRNFNMTLVATRTLDMDARIWYLRTLVRGGALRQFYLLSADVENIKTLNVDYFIKGLAFCFSLCIHFQKQITRCAAE